MSNGIVNFGSRVTGSGSDYAFTKTMARVDFGGTDVELVLDAPGTYLLLLQTSCTMGFGGDLIEFQFFDATNSQFIGTLAQQKTAASGAVSTFFLTAIVTIGTPITVQVYGRNATNVAGIVTSTRMRMNQVRLT